MKKEEEKSPLMPLKDVALKMGVSQQTIRIGLQRKIFPFGWAIKRNHRYSYYIPRKMFEEYFGEEAS